MTKHHRAAGKADDGLFCPSIKGIKNQGKPVGPNATPAASRLPMPSFLVCRKLALLARNPGSVRCRGPERKSAKSLAGIGRYRKIPSVKGTECPSKNIDRPESAGATPLSRVPCGQRPELPGRGDQNSWICTSRSAVTSALTSAFPAGRPLRHSLRRREAGRGSGRRRPRADTGIPAAFNQPGTYIFNLGKGVLGENAATMLGRLILAQLQAAAFKRERDGLTEAKVPTKNYCLIDECHNFVNHTTGMIVSETRKCGLSLILVQQYTGQGIEPGLFKNIMTNTPLKFTGVGTAGTYQQVAECQQVDRESFAGLKPRRFHVSTGSSVPFIATASPVLAGREARMSVGRHDKLTPWRHEN